jgi:hypothetical protein
LSSCNASENTSVVTRSSCDASLSRDNGTSEKDVILLSSWKVWEDADVATRCRSNALPSENDVTRDADLIVLSPCNSPVYEDNGMWDADHVMRGVRNASLSADTVMRDGDIVTVPAYRVPCHSYKAGDMDVITVCACSETMDMDPFTRDARKALLSADIVALSTSSAPLSATQ